MTMLFGGFRSCAVNFITHSYLFSSDISPWPYLGLASIFLSAG
jgi:hypothetical protein